MKPLISMRKVVQAGNVVVLDEKNVIKLDVNNEVCIMDMWVCLDETGPVFNWQGRRVARVSQTNLQDQGRSAAVRVKKVAQSKRCAVWKMVEMR